MKEQESFCFESLKEICVSAPVGIGVFATGSGEPLFLNDAYRRLFRRGSDWKPAGRTCTILHEDGSEGRVDVTTAPVVVDGKDCDLCFFEDVTEKANELAFARDRQRLHLAVDEMKAAVVEWDYQTGEFFSSSAYKEYALSLEPPESLFSGSCPEDAVHPDDRPALMEFLSGRGRGKFRGETLLRMRLVQGGYRWCRLVSLRYRDGNAKPQRTLVVIIDIGKEKEKELMLRSLLNELSGGVAIFKVGKLLECLYYNEGFSKLSDFSREEIEDAVRRNSLPEAMVAFSDLPRVRQEIRTRTATGEDINLTFRIRTKGNELRWIHMTARKLREEDGCPVYYCVYTLPPEEAALYRNIVEDSTTGILVAERKSRRIVYVNESLRKFFQVGPDIVVQGKVVLDFIKEEEVLLSDEEIRGLSLESFKECHRKIGSRFVSVKAKNVTWNGEDCYVLYVTDETSEHKKSILQEKLLNLVPTGIGLFELHGDGTVSKVYVNDGYYRMIGEEREIRQVKEKGNLMAFVHPDETAALQASLLRLGEGSDEESVDFRILCGDGAFRWFRLAASVAKREEGNLMLYCNFSDIDEAVNAREALKRNNLEIQKQYAQELAQRKMLEKDSLIVVRFNVTKDKLISYRYNQDLVHNFETGTAGTSIRPGIVSQIPTEEERRTASDFFDVGKTLSRYQNGIREFSAVYRRRLNDGRLYWLQSICRLAKDEENGDLISYTYLHNIDLEHKRTLTAESLIDEETDFVMLLNVVSSTAVLLRLTEGFPCDEWPVGQEFPFGRIPSLPSLDIVESEDKANVQGFFQQDNIVSRLREKPVIMQIYRCRKGNGIVRRKKLRAFYLDAIHEDIVIAGRDITDIYQEEQEQKRILQKALEDAKAASCAKSDFLSRMSHDLRTPMNVIIGLTSMAADDPSDSSPEMRKMLSDISDSANYLLSLVNDCLDLEKITSGKLELHPSACSYAEFSDSLRAIINPLCKEKGITFVLTRPEDGGPSVLADKMRLKQVFFNLLSNAVKFSPKGGKVEFIVRNISVSDGFNRFDCIIRDNGIGMSEEFQEHMFEPFSQETNGITPGYQGSGLGLSIVKQLVDLMGAKIQVRSRLGEGTEFTLSFDFPVVEEPLAAQAIPQLSTERLKGKRILLAEDHPLNTLIAVRLLEKKGMEVTTAENGKVALDAFSQSPDRFYDAILLDIRMPVMNGLETAKAIRSLDRKDAKSVPIIAMTANAFDSDVKASLKAGMDAHLSKPIEPQKLYETLALHIS